MPTFNPELIESTTISSDGFAVDIYKVGGGTLGKLYTGIWGYRFASAAGMVESGENLYTGSPSTHDQVAALVLDIFAPTKE